MVLSQLLAGALVLVTTMSVALARIQKLYKATEITCDLQRIYHPSALELKWVHRIDSVTDKTAKWLKGCKLMREDASQLRKLVDYYKLWQNVDEWVKVEGWREEGILSYFEMIETCDGVKKTTYAPIEPLVGYLRHPLYHCLGGPAHLVDKDYMFILHKNFLFPSVKQQSAISTNYLFDLGASTYLTGGGGASQSWFVESYRQRGIELDRIMAWEVMKMTPEEVFKEYPNDVVEKVSYFNLPADPKLIGKMSPVRMMKAIVRPQDFLTMKVDIDNDEVELAIIQSFQNDVTVTDLIDEFFFEHHVSSHPVEHMGWINKTRLMNITQSYQLFTDLRKKGIRAHSWV